MGETLFPPSVLHFCLRNLSPPVCTCIYTVVLVPLSPDEGKRRLPKHLKDQLHYGLVQPQPNMNEACVEGVQARFKQTELATHNAQLSCNGGALKAHRNNATFHAAYTAANCMPFTQTNSADKAARSTKNR